MMDGPPEIQDSTLLYMLLVFENFRLVGRDWEASHKRLSRTGAKTSFTRTSLVEAMNTALKRPAQNMYDRYF